MSERMPPGAAGKYCEVMQQAATQKPSDCIVGANTIARVDTTGHIRLDTDNLTYEQATALASWIGKVYG